MKTERRHELQTNALADWLGDQVERLRPYTRLAVGVLIAIVVAIGLYSYLSTQSVYRTEQGWQRYFAAIDALRQKGDASELTQLAEASEFANTAPGYWAQLSLGDFHLNEGISQLFSDRAAATNSLRAAVDNYSRVTDQRQQPMLAERAILGAARAYESLNELEKARVAYEALATKGTGPFATEAQQRLRDLGQEPTKRFYDWFFAATPPRQGLGGPGLPGVRPNFDSLPTESSFDQSSTGSLLATPPNKDAPAAPEGNSPETPAGEPAQPDPQSATSEAAPPADAPAAETPAAESPSAADAPPK